MFAAILVGPRQRDPPALHGDASRPRFTAPAYDAPRRGRARASEELSGRSDEGVQIGVVWTRRALGRWDARRHCFSQS